MGMRNIRVIYDGADVVVHVDGVEMFRNGTAETFDVEITRRAIEMATEVDLVAMRAGTADEVVSIDHSRA